MDQANEQQRQFNEWSISELHGEVDSIQTSLKLLFTLQQLQNVVSIFQLGDGKKD
jgi:hypothetical protein